MLSPSRMARSKSKRDLSAAICLASSYWTGSPVPKSPNARNFSDPSRLGSGTGASAGAGGPDAIAGPAGCAVETPHADATYAATSTAASNAAGLRGHRIINDVDNEVRLHVEQDQVPIDKPEFQTFLEFR